MKTPLKAQKSSHHLSVMENIPIQRNTLRINLLNKMSDGLPSLKHFNHRASYGGPQHQQLSQLQIRAKNYLHKYKIVNDPFTTFSLVNIILEQRQRMLQESDQNNQLKKNSQNSINNNTSSSLQNSTCFLPSIHQKGNSKLALHEDRQQVIDLAKWLDTKLQKIKTKSVLQLQDILEYKQSVVNLALAEIVRLVNKNCKQLGKLLKLVFDSTFEVFQKMIQILLKNGNHRQSDNINQQRNVQKMYDQRIKNQIQQKSKISQELNFLMQNFKKLIISNRTLKKQKKQLQFQFKMNQYSLQSYRQGYSVALEMALQSNDSNILNWAKKILSKLIRDRKQKHKNIQQIKADTENYKQAKQVVFNWLRRNVQQYQPEMFQKYQHLDLNQQFLEAKKLSEQKKMNQNKNGRLNQQLQQNQQYYENKKLQSKTSQNIRFSNTINKGLQTQNNSNNKNLICKQTNQINRKFDNSSSQDQNEINIYDYFKCYDIGTSMDITYANTQTGNHYQSFQIGIQTQFTKRLDAWATADIVLERFDQSGIHNKSGDQLPFIQCENGTEQSDERSHFHKKQKLKKKIKQKESSAFTIQRLITQNSNKIKHNMVQVKRYQGRGLRINKQKQNLKSRRNSLVYLNQQKDPIQITRQLQLKRFNDIFQHEQEILMRNPVQFVRNIQTRRSYYVHAQVQYNTYAGYEKNNQVRVIFRKIYKNQGATNEYGELSKKIKHILQKNQNTSNLMKLKTFKQNLNIFTAIQSDLKQLKIRQQKISPTLSMYCKLISSLIIDYVKGTKKEKQDKIQQKQKLQKFFYPLNVLFVDRFNHTYGLKDIAQKNMKNTLSTIMGLLDKSDRMRLFFWLLGCVDKNVGGDELQIYVRCLVYFDITGKISLNQATMKDFNIDKLNTDKSCIKQNISKITDGFFDSIQTEQILASINSKIQGSENICIQVVSIIIIQFFLRKRSKLQEQYMPIYNFLIRNNQFLSNFVELIKYLKLGSERQTQILKYFSINQDVIQDNSRSITAPHFLSCCIKINFPTISVISIYLSEQLKSMNVPQKFYQDINLRDKQCLDTLMIIKRGLKMMLQPYIIKQLENNLKINNFRLIQFWWKFQIFKMSQAKIYECINSIIGNFRYINLEAYSSVFKKK